jgi:hypothetical protein
LFTFYDDSRDKLSVDTLFLVFAAWIFGMALSSLCLLLEILAFKFKAAKARANQLY